MTEATPTRGQNDSFKQGRRNVLVLIPNLGRGGAQKVFREQVELLKHHYNVFPCVFNRDGAFSEDLTDDLLSLDVPPGRNWLEKASNFRSRIKRLWEIKRKHKIDIAISHLEGADYVNILSRTSELVFIWIHGSKIFDRNIKGVIGLLRHRVLMPVLYKRADRVVAVSDGIRSELKKSNIAEDEYMVVVRNGVDIAEVANMASQTVAPGYEKLLKDYFVVITHCRFSAQKNLTGLVKVIARLKHVTKIKWIISGDGEERDRILQQCTDQKIAAHHPWGQSVFDEKCQLFFTGYLANPFPYLKASSMYIMTSLWEGFPLSLCEALAVQLPVVAADCQTGPKEILHESNNEVPVASPFYGNYGILMPLLSERENPNAIQVWCDMISSLSDDHNRLHHYRRKSAEAIQRFSLEQWKHRTLEVVKGTL